MDDEWFKRIEDKQDKILDLASRHEVQINDPKMGILSTIGKHDEDIGSLKTSRTRFLGLLTGLSVSGGSFGAWLSKWLPSLSGGGPGPHQ